MIPIALKERKKKKKTRYSGLIPHFILSRESMCLLNP
jgi:hypothetical protein